MEKPDHFEQVLGHIFYEQMQVDVLPLRLTLGLLAFPRKIVMQHPDDIGTVCSRDWLLVERCASRWDWLAAGFVTGCLSRPVIMPLYVS